MYVCTKCWMWEWFAPCEYDKALFDMDVEVWELE